MSNFAFTNCRGPALSMGRRRFLQMAAALASIPLSGRLGAKGLPQRVAVPGGFALVDLGAEKSAPVVHFNGERVLVSGNQSGWLAIVGIPLDSKPGRAAPVTIQYAAGTPRVVHFTIGDKHYDSEYLTIKSDQVDLTPEDLARYEAERTHTQSVLRTYSDSAPASLLLIPPCQGMRSSTFGQLRFFNGQPRGPHNGMDIAAEVGMPVVSAGSGKIIDTGDYFFSGRTVMINHGRGFITLYAHLDQIDVKLSNRVRAGQRIGKVGISGRVTGPHLHFGVYLNAAAVDPGLFLPWRVGRPVLASFES
jgi:murein DD-endopeptidase MepM/ murein hydrolase activator NlpD